MERRNGTVPLGTVPLWEQGLSGGRIGVAGRGRHSKNELCAKNDDKEYSREDSYCSSKWQRPTKEKG